MKKIDSSCEKSWFLQLQMSIDIFYESLYNGFLVFVLKGSFYYNILLFAFFYFSEGIALYKTWKIPINS